MASSFRYGADGKALLDLVLGKGAKIPKQEKPKDGYYGGFELKKGDNDAKQMWGGKAHEEEGAFVQELQEDLFASGYWVTQGTSAPAIGD